MAGFKVTLSLSGNSITLKKLTENIVNTHLNQLNDIFELLHKEEIKENLSYFENVYRRLLEMDVFQHYKVDPVKTPLADTMAEFYESTKSTFVSKIDFITPILLRTSGKKGLVTKSLLNILQKEEKKPVEHKKIIRLIKIYSQKENLALFDTEVSETGVLELKYREIRKYCLGRKYCRCNSTGNIPDNRSVQLFRFILKGEVKKPYWQMISPIEMPFPLGLLYPYIEKNNKINHQRKIYQIYKEMCDNEKDILSPTIHIQSNKDIDLNFLDFTLSFWGATLRITANEGTLKYRDYTFTAGLDMCVYEKELTRIFSHEIDRKWSYLGISKKIAFQIQTGLIFEIFENTEHKETHIFKYPRGLVSFLASYQTKQFYINISNILQNYTFSSIQNYETAVFGENNVMIRDQNYFIIVSSNLWVGKIVKFGLVRHQEIYFDHSKICSDKKFFQNDINQEPTRLSGYTVLNDHSLSMLEDLNLLFLAIELYLSQNIHFILKRKDLEFLWDIESNEFEILVRTLINQPPFIREKGYLVVISHQSHIHNIFIKALDDLQNFLTFLVVKQKLIESGIVIKEKNDNKDQMLTFDEGQTDFEKVSDTQKTPHRTPRDVLDVDINQNQQPDLSANQMKANKILKSLTRHLETKSKTNREDDENSSKMDTRTTKYQHNVPSNNHISQDLDQKSTVNNQDTPNFLLKNSQNDIENPLSHTFDEKPVETPVKMDSQTNQEDNNSKRMKIDQFRSLTDIHLDNNISKKDSNNDFRARMESEEKMKQSGQCSSSIVNQQHSYDKNNNREFSFMFYNLPIIISYEKKTIFKSKNSLLTSLIDDAVDKNHILLNIITYLKAIKPIIKINIKPFIFTGDLMMFWFDEKIIFKFIDQKYYWNDQELEKVADRLKQMELRRKLSKIKKKMSKWCEREEDSALHFETELGQISLSIEKTTIRLTIATTVLKKNEQSILEKLFYNIMNFEEDYLRYFDVLLSIQKARSVINSLEKK